MHSEEMMKKVGNELRKIRTQREFTLDELADRTGVSKLTLGKIERGETNPTLGVMWKITTGLNIPLTKLVSVEPSDWTLYLSAEKVFSQRTGRSVESRIYFSKSNRFNY